MTKDKLSEDILKSAEELLEKEQEEGCETYYVAKRLARLAGFTGKEEHFEEAIRLLRQVNHSKEWRDEIISLMATAYARAGDHVKAWEWSDKLYSKGTKDVTRLAIINLLLEKGKVEITEKLLESFLAPNMYLKGLLAIAASTGKIKYFRQAYKYTLSTCDPTFDQIEALMDIEEVLEKTISQNKNAKNNDE